MRRLSVDALIEQASQQTGLSDFGPPDYLEGLSVLVDGLNDEAGIREDSRTALNERLVRLLVNRLWMAKDIAEHPEIVKEDPGAPIVIASLPRTGSTKVHRMLGASGDFQTLKFWQAHMFSRIPGQDDGGRALRIEKTRRYERWMYDTSPSILTGHPMFTDEPEEDQWLVEGTFRHPVLFGLYDSTRYAQWIMKADLQPCFDYLRTQISYLQWQSPDDRGKPWLLKTPSHLGSEAELSQLFPQPRFIVTHRDPARCIASIASTCMAMRYLYSDRDSLEAMGPGLVGMFAQTTTEHMRWRDQNPNVPVLDLSFDEVNSNGMAAVQKVYDFFGMPLSARAESAMQAWQDNNGREKHGKSAYSSGAIGTTDEAIREAFAPYIERFSSFL